MAYITLEVILFYLQDTEFVASDGHAGSESPERNKSTGAGRVGGGVYKGKENISH